MSNERSVPSRFDIPDSHLGHINATVEHLRNCGILPEIAQRFAYQTSTLFETGLSDFDQWSARHFSPEATALTSNFYLPPTPSARALTVATTSKYASLFLNKKEKAMRELRERGMLGIGTATQGAIAAILLRHADDNELIAADPIPDQVTEADLQSLGLANHPNLTCSILAKAIAERFPKTEERLREQTNVALSLTHIDWVGVLCHMNTMRGASAKLWLELYNNAIIAANQTDPTAVLSLAGQLSELLGSKAPPRVRQANKSQLAVIENLQDQAVHIAQNLTAIYRSLGYAVPESLRVWQQALTPELAAGTLKDIPLQRRPPPDEAETVADTIIDETPLAIAALIKESGHFIQLTQVILPPHATNEELADKLIADYQQTSQSNRRRNPITIVPERLHGLLSLRQHAEYENCELYRGHGSWGSKRQPYFVLTFTYAGDEYAVAERPTTEAATYIASRRVSGNRLAQDEPVHLLVMISRNHLRDLGGIQVVHSQSAPHGPGHIAKIHAHVRALRATAPRISP